MITAYYKRRDGAGCTRTVATAADAKHILTGGYNALSVTLRDENGDKVGERVDALDGWPVEDRRVRWNWWLDNDAFTTDEELQQ